jgi:hypothetical protein
MKELSTMPELNSNSASVDPTVSKLLDVDADLSTQEAQLLAQLETVRDKRKSLQSVIGMFSPIPASADAPVVSQPTVEPPLTNAVPAAAEVTSVPVESNGSATTASAPKKTRKPRATASKAKTPAKAPKKTKRGQDLQQYMRSEFESISLPQAVATVLQEQSNSVVGIPQIIESVFVEEIPKEMRSKASTRIANVLSAGLKENKWYRGRTGHYSISRNAAMADLTS